MRVIGILAIACVVVSFLLWLGNWMLWTFFYALITSLPWLATVQSVTAFIANVLELLSILLVAIGLILASRKAKES
jgi:hypothetical protein